MRLNVEGLSPQELAVVSWQFRLCGGFKAALWEAIARADEGNLARLEYAFPIEVEGFRLYAYEPGWWKNVRNRVTNPERITP